jgi:hypothetical protein
MDLTDLLTPIISSGGTFLITNWWNRRELKTDLETKLTKRIEEVSQQFIEVNEKYMLLYEKFIKAQEELI